MELLSHISGVRCSHYLQITEYSWCDEIALPEIWKSEFRYEQIQFAVRERILMSPMTYDALNHPDEEYLKLIYPSDVIKNMPDWIRHHLSSEESQKACDRYADAILADSFLLSEFMKNYDISQNGIDRYQDEIDRIEETEVDEPEDIDYDEVDFSEPDDEETFRAQNEEFDRQM